MLCLNPGFLLLASHEYQLCPGGVLSMGRAPQGAGVQGRVPSSTGLQTDG